MYIVISQWEGKSDNFAQIIEAAKQPREWLRAQPGVRMVETVLDGNVAHVIHAYDSEAAYNKIVNDPNSGFAKSLADSGIEGHADWIGSVRGETLGD